MRSKTTAIFGGASGASGASASARRSRRRKCQLVLVVTVVMVTLWVAFPVLVLQPYWDEMSVVDGVLLPEAAAKEEMEDSSSSSSHNAAARSNNQTTRGGAPLFVSAPNTLAMEPASVDETKKAPITALSRSSSNNNITAIAAEEVRNMRYYFLHTPKTGGIGLKTMLLQHGFPLKDLGHKLSNRKTTNPTSDFDEWVKKFPAARMFMTEGHGFRDFFPRHSLTVVREPRAHVLSQYFHCKESKYVARFSEPRPESLSSWLTHWNALHKKQSVPDETDNDPWFHCHIPVNMQSRLMGFPNPDALSSMFEVVGLQSQMETTLCLFLIHIDKRIPASCNCTDRTGIVVADDAGAAAKKWEDELRGHHGNVHHGDTYKNVTRAEEEIIVSLTRLDQELYARAKILFAQQVAKVESTYGVRLCGRDNNDEASSARR